MSIRERQTILDPACEYMVVRNTAGIVLSKGMSVCFDVLAANAKGISVVVPDSFNLGAYAGVVADPTIDEQEFGRILISGWCDYALVQPDIIQAIALGDQLGVTVGDTTLYRIASATPGSEVVSFTAYGTVSLPPTPSKVLVRARR